MPITSLKPAIEIPEIPVAEYAFAKMRDYGNDLAMMEKSERKATRTFAEVVTQATNCGNSLRRLGFEKGDVAVVMVSVCIEYPVAILGILACGGTVSMCSPECTEGEIMRQFGIAEPKYVFTEEMYVSKIERLMKNSKIPSVKDVFVVGHSEKFRTFASLVENGDDEGEMEDIVINTKNDLAVLPSSSGTTGLPKCVALTHHCFLAQLLIFGSVTNNYRGERCLTVRPPQHASGYIYVLAMLQTGLTIVFDRDQDPTKILATVEEYKINHVLLVPPEMIVLAKMGDYASFDVSSWKESICGTAPLSRPILETLTERYNITLFPVYGLTECLPVSCNDVVNRYVTSVGHPCANITLKVIDIATGKEKEIGEDGEIMAKGPQLFEEYYKNLEATEKAFDDEGFLHTGDLGHIDEHGMLYVTDRLKELIKYGETDISQISPAELESVLLNHPKIKDVGIVGVPHPMGEAPKAYVVRKDTSLSAEEVKNFVKEHLSDHKQLRGGVEFIEAIPKSRMGKIQRQKLKLMSQDLKEA